MEKFGHCGTCKYWNQKGSAGEKKQFGECNAIGTMQRAYQEHVGDEKTLSVILTGIGASLIMRSTFGCVLHERVELEALPPPTPLRTRRLTLQERIERYAAGNDTTVEAASTKIRFLTNLTRHDEFSDDIESPQHFYLDRMNIPREIAVDD